MSGWGTGWLEEAAPISKEAWDNLELVKNDTLIHGIGVAKVTIDSVEHVPLSKVYLNLKPTHDPYSNPNANIYYQCDCGAVLDPGTKSFAALNNCASEKGWKIRWGAHTYIPYCVKCGEDVE
jgi:hypothetical protein